MEILTKNNELIAKKFKKKILIISQWLKIIVSPEFDTTVHIPLI